MSTMANRRCNSVDEADSESDDEIYTVDTRQSLQDIAHKLRAQAIKVTTQQKEGFPTSCSSVAEIISVLFFNPMHFNKARPKDPGNDRIILSNSNALPMVYAAWAEVEYIKPDDIRATIRSDVEGPAPLLNVVDVNLGSLEQGVSVAVGMAYVRQFVDASLYWVYCVVVDASLAGNSVLEALRFAGHYKLKKLVIVFDLNGDQILDRAQGLTKTLSEYGFSTTVTDGHNCEALTQAFHQAFLDDEKFGRPTAIICKTIKGNHFPGYMNKNDYHGQVFEKTEALALMKHVESLHRQYGEGEHDNYDLISGKESSDGLMELPKLPVMQAPEYSKGELVSTYRAFENSLLKLSSRLRRLLYLPGCGTDTKGSVLSVTTLKERYVGEETGVNAIGIAIGMARRNRTVPVVSASADFFVRNFEHVTMGANSKINLSCVGSHAGVVVGEAEAGQPVLNDLALFCSIKNSHVFYPSDAVSCEYSVGLAATTKGICYIRTTNLGCPVLYENKEKFRIGQARVIRESSKDQVLLIGIGITVHEALKAARELETLNIFARVLDPFTIKPLDKQGILYNASQCDRRIVVVEDHQSEGGLGLAVREIMVNVPGVVLKSLTMTLSDDTDSKIPHRGTPEELLTLYRIDSRAIVEAAQEVLIKIEVEACTDTLTTNNIT